MLDPQTGFLANLQSFILIPETYNDDDVSRQDYLLKYGSSVS